jgi:hypothetical protein
VRGGVVIGNVFEHIEQGDGIEGTVGERQSARVTADKRGAIAQGEIEVDGHDLGIGIEQAGKAAAAATDLEQSASAAVADHGGRDAMDGAHLLPVEQAVGPSVRKRIARQESAQRRPFHSGD